MLVYAVERYCAATGSIVDSGFPRILWRVKFDQEALSRNLITARQDDEPRRMERKDGKTTACGLQKEPGPRLSSRFHGARLLRGRPWPQVSLWNDVTRSSWHGSFRRVYERLGRATGSVECVTAQRCAKAQRCLRYTG